MQDILPYLFCAAAYAAIATLLYRHLSAAAGREPAHRLLPPGNPAAVNRKLAPTDQRGCAAEKLAQED